MSTQKEFMSGVEMDSVSAVIPTRNRAELVTRAVQSALAQTHPLKEVIVVIDGPDETTANALRTLTDPRLKVLALENSVGGGEARNVGVQAASSSWIAFLDDDDEWFPNKIESQLRVAAETNAPWPVVSCRLIGRSPQREYVWPRRLPDPGEPVSEYILARRGLFQGEGSVTTTTLLVKRDLLLQVPFGSGQRRHQEWDWLFRAMQVSGTRLVFAPEPLCVWYVEERRKSISSGNDWRYSYEWIERIRPLITLRAYASFLLVIVSPVAARAGNRRACFTVLKEALRKGKPAVIDLLLFCGMVLVPQDFRRQLRVLLSR
jgi:glycosyltransferase involved in cell wall biosynthesis